MAARQIPASDIVYSLDYKGGFNNGSSLPATFTDVTLDDRGFGCNGTSSIISVPNIAQVNLTDNFSVELYFKFTNAPASATSPIRKGTGNPTTVNYLIYLNNTPTLSFYVSKSDSSTSASRMSGTLSTGTWYHFVGTFSSTRLRLYKDGSKFGADIATGWTAYQSTETLDISDIWVAGQYLDGFIKRVAIYKKELTANEVTDLYNKATYGGHL